MKTFQRRIKAAYLSTPIKLIKSESKRRGKQNLTHCGETSSTQECKIMGKFSSVFMGALDVSLHHTGPKSVCAHTCRPESWIIDEVQGSAHFIWQTPTVNARELLWKSRWMSSHWKEIFCCLMCAVYSCHNYLRCTAGPQACLQMSVKAPVRGFELTTKQTEIYTDGFLWATNAN